MKYCVTKSKHPSNTQWPLVQYHHLVKYMQTKARMILLWWQFLSSNKKSIKKFRWTEIRFYTHICNELCFAFVFPSHIEVVTHIAMGHQVFFADGIKWINFVLALCPRNIEREHIILCTDNKTDNSCCALKLLLCF